MLEKCHIHSSPTASDQAQLRIDAGHWPVAVSLRSLDLSNSTYMSSFTDPQCAALFNQLPQQLTALDLSTCIRRPAVCLSVIGTRLTQLKKLQLSVKHNHSPQSDHHLCVGDVSYLAGCTALTHLELERITSASPSTTQQQQETAESEQQQPFWELPLVPPHMNTFDVCTQGCQSGSGDASCHSISRVHQQDTQPGVSLSGSTSIQGSPASSHVRLPAGIHQLTSAAAATAIYEPVHSSGNTASSAPGSLTVNVRRRLSFGSGSGGVLPTLESLSLSNKLGDQNIYSSQSCTSAAAAHTDSHATNKRCTCSNCYHQYHFALLPSSSRPPVWNASAAWLLPLVNMQHLSITVSPWVDDSVVPHLAVMHSLQSLDWSGCSQLSGAGFEYISGASQLTRLELNSCSSLIDEGVACVCAALPGLRQLGLRGCSRLSNAAMTSICHLTQLRVLAVADNNQLDVRYAEFSIILPHMT